MKKKIATALFLSVLVLFSCKNDDNYTALSVEVADDFVEILQNETIEIDVLANDLNIPNSGSLTVSAVQHGNLEVLDPNATPANPSDDVLRYSVNANFTGQESFQYTICDGSGNDCASATVSIEIQGRSPVYYNPAELPYEKLSDSNFFEGTMSDLEPVFGVVPYEPISTLFSDYAKKKRFLWMPNNTSASYVSDHEVLDFPEGTILIKNFYLVCTCSYPNFFTGKFRIC